jgi:hypothetical protein
MNIVRYALSIIVWVLVGVVLALSVLLLTVNVFT